MKLFKVTIPIAGFLRLLVKAENKEAAIVEALKHEIGGLDDGEVHWHKPEAVENE
jgi:hypothetical protein